MRAWENKYMSVNYLNRKLSEIEADKQEKG